MREKESNKLQKSNMLYKGNKGPNSPKSAGKEAYQALEMETVVFESEDVITASNPSGLYHPYEIGQEDDSDYE